MFDMINYIARAFQSYRILVISAILYHIAQDDESYFPFSMTSSKNSEVFERVEGYEVPIIQDMIPSDREYLGISFLLYYNPQTVNVTLGNKNIHWK